MDSGVTLGERRELRPASFYLLSLNVRVFPVDNRVASMCFWATEQVLTVVCAHAVLRELAKPQIQKEQWGCCLSS